MCTTYLRSNPRVFDERFLSPCHAPIPDRKLIGEVHGDPNQASKCLTQEVHDFIKAQANWTGQTFELTTNPVRLLDLHKTVRDEVCGQVIGRDSLATSVDNRLGKRVDRNHDGPTEGFSSMRDRGRSLRHTRERSME